MVGCGEKKILCFFYNLGNWDIKKSKLLLVEGRVQKVVFHSLKKKKRTFWEIRKGEGG